MATVERYEQATWDELPDRFTDPRCDDFHWVCSNGCVGGISIGSAFVHKPARWPQCFPDGEEGQACCTRVLLRKVVM